MKRLIGWASLTAILLWTGVALADEQTEAELLKRLEQQEERIKILERRLEVQDETATTATSLSAGRTHQDSRATTRDPGRDRKDRGQLHTDRAGQYQGILVPLT